MVDKDLLEILACPQCKGGVQFNEEENTLLCSSCNLIYEIRNDIPIMLVDEATPVN